jgi:hypothetical protein
MLYFCFLVEDFSFVDPIAGLSEFLGTGIFFP